MSNGPCDFILTGGYHFVTNPTTTSTVRTIEELLQMSTHRYHKYIPIWLLLGISVVAAPRMGLAEVHVEGTAAAVHVTTDKDAIPDVLSAFEAPFNLRYRTAVPLDGNVSSVYSGSLTHVISRLLGGYDYVIAHDQGTMEIVVWGKRAEVRMPVQKPTPMPVQKPTYDARNAR